MLIDRKVFVYRITAFVSTWLMLLCGVQSQQKMPPTIFLGAIFDEGEASAPLEAAFKHGIDMVNDDRTLLASSRLMAKIERVTASNSFKASKKVCQLFQQEVVALFSPVSSTAATNHIRSTCKALSVPHIETGFEYLEERSEFSVNLSPHPWAIGSAIANLVQTLSWKTMVILYESEESLVRLQELTKLPKGFEDVKISFRQLYTDTDDYRPLLKQIKEEKLMRIVLDCSFEKIESVLKQAAEINMLTDYHSYIINSLDLERIDISPYKHTDVNITGFRIVDTSKPKAMEYLKEWKYLTDDKGNFGRGRNHPLFSDNAMLYDAVWTLAKGLDELGTMKPLHIEPVRCQAGRENTPGKRSAEEVKKKLLGTDYEGITGEIHLDETPGWEFRSDVKFDLVEKDGDRMVKTGIWSLETGINYTKSETQRGEEMVQKLQNKTLRVVTWFSAPYIMKKELDPNIQPETLERMSFAEKHEGYVVDLIKELSRQVKFKYTMALVGDGAYGSYNPATGQWNGMIRELIEHKADLSCIDMSITSQRQQAIDFAMPFMNTGVGILFKKKKPPPPNLFSFLAPLSVDVWIYIVVAYLLSSILLFLLGRITPYEWDNPHPCVDDPDELETCFDLKNCLWFGMGSLMCQGSDILPKAISTRTVASIWWFFTLIIISSYTANLAAFLTAAKMESPVNNADDLAKQTKIKYGLKAGGSTDRFFKTSTIPTYEKLNAAMESAKPSVYTNGNKEGKDRVIKDDGAYAFFMEAAALQYYMERDCELTQIGGLLDNKGYGVGLPPDSPYTKAISDGILQLQEKGILTKLRNKWWKEKHVPEIPCGAKGGDDNSAQLGLANLGGVFIVLAAGVIISCFLAVAEFMWESRGIVQDRNESAWVEIAKEMRFAVDCTAGDSKPNPDKEGGGSSRSSKKESKSVLDDHSHPYGVIADKEGDSAYAQFNDNLSAKSKH